MSYRLQEDEKLPEGLKRIALEEIDDALDYLDSTDDDDLDEAVHESRKCFKKLRGLLRLVRKEIGKDVYKRENVCFRDAGRLLADLRDSKVAIETLDDLMASDEETLDDELFESMREALLIFYRTTRQQVVYEEEALAEAAGMIEVARDRVEDWPIDVDSFTAVAGGLRKVYKRGRNRLADAEASPTTAAFHEWRKRVKYLWYNVRLLRPIWPDPMKALADEIHDLSDYLGDEHDLAELAALVEERPLLLDEEVARTALLSRIDSQRKELQAKAFRQGHRIYLELPEAFVDRMAAYWEVTRT